MSALRRSAFFVLLPLLWLTPSAPADEVEHFLTQWAEQLQDMRTLEVHFEQTRHLRILRRPRISSGVAYVKGARLFMVVEGEGERRTELLVEGGRASIYYPALQRLEVYRLDAGAPPTPLPVFGGDVHTLTEEYHVALEEKEGAPVLVLTPRQAPQGGQTVRLRFQDYQVVELVRTSPNGDRTEMRVTSTLRNRPIPEERFHLDVPEGTRVVHFPEEDPEGDE